MDTPLFLCGTSVPIMTRSRQTESDQTPPNVPGPQQKRQVLASDSGQRLLTAICKGDLTALDRQLLAEHPTLCHPLTGCSTLQLAVIMNNQEMLTILLSNDKIDPNFRDNAGRTALHYAAVISKLTGDSTIYYTLTEKGAKDYIPDCEGFTALDVYQNPSLIDMEKIRYMNRYPLTLKNEWDHLFPSQSENSLSKLTQTQLNHPQSQSLPPQLKEFGKLEQIQAQILGIWDAIISEDERTLKQLLYSGNMALYRDLEGRTPLHIAYKCGYQPCIDYLLKLCPEAAITVDKKGRRPRDYMVKEAKLRASDRRRKRVRCFLIFVVNKQFKELIIIVLYS
ncbi:ankyrin repeat protein [Dictyocaulus viviparus]|uniref:Ankyrin repeat protein n=1 Tax=Dictyocaulus viviparus TaxID=29172 RepID=A0A0D8YD38_DICVI|nr:ankyrin repeat protein [Dictyocaulus viviparus]